MYLARPRLNFICNISFPGHLLNLFLKSRWMLSHMSWPFW